MEKKKSGGQVKCFGIESNQKLWEKYYAHKLEEAEGKQLKTDPKITIAQYKVGLLVLESMTGRAFESITASDLQTLDAHYNSNKGNHLPYVKAFLLTAITKGWIKLNSAELALYLLPVEYNGLMLAVMEVYNVAV